MQNYCEKYATRPLFMVKIVHIIDKFLRYLPACSHKRLVTPLNNRRNINNFIYLSKHLPTHGGPLGARLARPQPSVRLIYLDIL